MALRVCISSDPWDPVSALQSRLAQGMLMMLSTRRRDAYTSSVNLGRGAGGSCRHVLEEKEWRGCYVVCVCVCLQAVTLQDEQIYSMNWIYMLFPAGFSVWTGKQVGSQYTAHTGKSAYLRLFSLVCIQVNTEGLLPTFRQKVCVQKSDMSAGVISETDQRKKTWLWLHRARPPASFSIKLNTRQKNKLNAFYH